MKILFLKNGKKAGAKGTRTDPLLQNKLKLLHINEPTTASVYRITACLYNCTRGTGTCLSACGANGARLHEPLGLAALLYARDQMRERPPGSSLHCHSASSSQLELSCDPRLHSLTDDLALCTQYHALLFPSAAPTEALPCHQKRMPTRYRTCHDDTRRHRSPPLSRPLLPLPPPLLPHLKVARSVRRFDQR